jgi:hypothetical protein
MTASRAQRPLRATALAAFCAATVVFLAIRDVLLPEVRDTEVWLGFELHGLAARGTAPLHWAIFAIGAWGLAHASLGVAVGVGLRVLDRRRSSRVESHE